MKIECIQENLNKGLSIATHIVNKNNSYVMIDFRKMQSEIQRTRREQFSLIDINSILINLNADRQKVQYILEQPVSKLNESA